MRLGWALLALLIICRSAAAEDIVAVLSTGRIAISSNFTGTVVTLFGSIERDAATVARRGGYNVVVIVRGPGETVTTRRKERLIGIWVNRSAETHVNVPSYYAILSNKPLDEIASPAIRRRLELGLEDLVLPVASDSEAESLDEHEDFAEAFLRLKRAQGLYLEIPDAVEFLTPTLFRAAIPIPANVPTGEFRVTILLFSDEALLRSRSTAIRIEKIGFEHQIVRLASELPLLYGLVTLAIAFFIGWLASVLFRRD